MPPEIRAQPVGRLHAAVREDAPGVAVEPRQGLGEIRHRPLALVEVVELGVEDATDLTEGAGVRDDRLRGDVWRLPAPDDDQRALGHARGGLAAGLTLRLA